MVPKIAPMTEGHGPHPRVMAVGDVLSEAAQLIIVGDRKLHLFSICAPFARSV